MELYHLSLLLNELVLRDILRVNVERSHIIHHNGDFHPVESRQDSLQKRCLARAKKPGQKRDGQALAVFSRRRFGRGSVWRWRGGGSGACGRRSSGHFPFRGGALSGTARQGLETTKIKTETVAEKGKSWSSSIHKSIKI